MSASHWVWGPERNEYRFFDRVNSRWVYQSEHASNPQWHTPATPYDTNPHQTQQPDVPRAPTTNASYYQGRQGRAASSSSHNELSYGLSNLSLDPGVSPSAYPYAPGNATSSLAVAVAQDSQRNYESPTYLQNPVERAGIESAPGLGANEVYADYKDVTVRKLIGEPASINSKLLVEGFESSTRLRGTPGDREKLDPGYEVKKPGYQFFGVGKVFKILWPELPGTSTENMTIATEPRFGENIAVKIRWFVVVREGHDCCSCLPIQTYRRQGVGKDTIVKCHHAIIYTGKRPPKPLDIEAPAKGEKGMLQPIRVRQRNPNQKMDSLSRVNFNKIYTVEHNVKVYDFGDVHKDDIWLLVQQFRSVWESGPSSARLFTLGAEATSSKQPYVSSPSGQTTGDVEREAEDEDEEE
ncbi:hypothetical protein BDY21DRAFT_116615 [Lineolata rhizophorae]|uniref:DUF6590 domain-containing protein n=1 Tax=Lineolata rhizophorae TaxID=578093 RepID=A0A6A6NQH8_9PEZI|nr:hypothetical protein BDY21DRAFT_116615 [Lineolata rhizophorae]